MSWLGGGTSSSSAPSTAPSASTGNAAGNKRPKTIYYLGILRTETNKPAVELAGDYDLTSFSYFTRDNYKQFIQFSTKTVAERTPVGTRHTIEEKIGKVHVYHTSFGFCAILITETEYDKFAAQSILSKAADNFKSKYTPTEVREKTPPLDWPEGKKMREEAITVEQSGVAAVQRELDETKIVLHQTIESVLQRGEKLDTLVAKSDELSGMSKGFYKQAKQQNSCCVVM